MSFATDARVFGIQMRSAFQRDATWVKDAGSTFVSAVASGARQEAAFLRDAVVNLRSNLMLIDDQILQKYLLTQWMSEFVQELHREEMQSRSDIIARDCIVSNDSNLKCVGSTALTLGDLGFAALNPMTYAKAACNSYVTLLLKNEAFTPDEAAKWRDRIRIAFLIKDLLKISKLMKELGECMTALKTAKRTLKGDYDKRYKEFKNAVKTTKEGFHEAVETLGSQLNELNKEP